MKKLDTKSFIQKAKTRHKNKYNYSLVEYVNVKSKVRIICKKHGVFKQAPNDHMNGCGCSACGKERLSSERKKPLEKFIDQCRHVHGNKYSYHEVVYLGADHLIEIMCKDHGSFWQLPNNHRRGNGCPLCYRDHHTFDGFSKRASKRHNGIYDYSKINNTKLGYDEKVPIICKKHGLFEQSKRAHLAGRGCPSCKHTNSIGQIEWIKSFKNPNIISPCYLKDARVLADGYDPTTKTVYEFYGDFWHANPKMFDHGKIHPILKKSYGEIYQKTINKEIKLISLGYHMITIWESEWKKIMANSRR